MQAALGAVTVAGVAAGVAEVARLPLHPPAATWRRSFARTCAAWVLVCEGSVVEQVVRSEAAVTARAR